MTKLLAIGGALLALLCGLAGWQLAEARADGLALDRQLAASKVREAQLGQRADSLAKTFHAETVWMRRADHEADRLRDSLAGLLVALEAARAHHDTVKVRELTASVVELAPTAVAAQDTARTSCKASLATCAQQFLVSDSLRRSADADRTRLEASLAAARRRPWIACGPGVAVTPAGGGLAAGCIYPLLLPR